MTKALTKRRGAGILCHITSLPSAFGIGDLDPEAAKFVDFLYRSKQRYWQLLPLNPVGAAQAFSPYSSISSMAGNALLISPELLREEGLISKDDLKRYTIKPNAEVNFNAAEEIRNEFFKTAYHHFLTNKKMMESFFCLFKTGILLVKRFCAVCCPQATPSKQALVCLARRT